jgi:hypothetical protein
VSGDWVRPVLLLLGAGFLAANLRLLVRFLRFRQVRRTAVLTWRPPAPPFLRLGLAMAFGFAALIVIKLVVSRRPAMDAFGELMMFLYYGYVWPLSLRIGHGFYERGVWLESGFLPYSAIGALAWREEPEPALLITPRGRGRAHRLVVPRDRYGEVRRLLRDRMADGAIVLEGRGLDLGAHDRRDDA